MAPINGPQSFLHFILSGGDNRGFGPEEYEIHQRFTRNGSKRYLLPWLRWAHRFGNPGGTKPPGLHREERLRGHLITHLDTGAPDLKGMREHLVDQTKSMTNEQCARVLADTVGEFFPRADTGRDCPHRQAYLRTVRCEIGCHATRADLPIFACTKYGECAPYKWQFKDRQQVCLRCTNRSDQSDSNAN